MRDLVSKVVSIAIVVVLAGLLAFAVMSRFVGTATQNNASDETQTPQGASSQLGDTRERMGSYVSTLKLGSGFYSGEVYRFGGNTICIEALCSAAGAGAVPHGTFTVELYRLDHGLIEVPLGSRTLKSRGLSSATWADVAPGEYFFRFSKEDDGCVLSSDNVWMYSYLEE